MIMSTSILNALPQLTDWTDTAFMALSDDQHYEIVNGEIIDMGNSGALHGYVCSLLVAALINYVVPKKLGVILDSSTAFTMKNGNKRSPDIAFLSKERLQGLTTLPSGYLEGAPDLIIEVLSPGNTIDEIDGKLGDYFENGAKLVWVIHPLQHYALVYRCAHEPQQLLKGEDTLDGEEVIVGFRLPIADLFKPLDF